MSLYEMSPSIQSAALLLIAHTNTLLLSSEALLPPTFTTKTSTPTTKKTKLTKKQQTAIDNDAKMDPTNGWDNIVRPHDAYVSEASKQRLVDGHRHSLEIRDKLRAPTQPPCTGFMVFCRRVLSARRNNPELLAQLPNKVVTASNVKNSIEVKRMWVKTTEGDRHDCEQVAAVNRVHYRRMMELFMKERRQIYEVTEKRLKQDQRKKKKTPAGTGKRPSKYVTKKMREDWAEKERITKMVVKGGGSASSSSSSSVSTSK